MNGSANAENITIDSVMEEGLDRLWDRLHRMGLNDTKVLGRLRDAWGADLAEQYNGWLEP